MSKLKRNKIALSVTIALIIVISVALIFAIAAHNSGKNALGKPGEQNATESETESEFPDIYLRFDMEAYDQIVAGYWAATSTYDLPKMFQASIANLTGRLPTLETDDRAGTAKMLAAVLDTASSSIAKADLALNIVNYLTYNLFKPQGRNRLLSEVQTTALAQEVSNVNPNSDLYKDLGTQKGADPVAIETSFKQKVATLSKATSTEAKTELAKAEYAHKVLTNTESRTLYDTAKIEPTVFHHITGKTLYIYMSRMSPTTLREFALAVDAASTTPAIDSLILDLRGNIGGDFSVCQNLLGLFIGPNQYAFDIFHQGTYEPQRTTQPRWTALERFKDMAILTDSHTQSTAEAVSAAFKRYNLATIIGTKTAGWGTVENRSYEMKTVIDPKQKFTLVLVEYLVLGADNQPIESNGVLPDIDTTRSTWKSSLAGTFKSSNITRALIEIAPKAPIK